MDCYLVFHGVVSDRDFVLRVEALHGTLAIHHTEWLPILLRRNREPRLYSDFMKTKYRHSKGPSIYQAMCYQRAILR
jgi:hypothetical protein